VDNLAEFAAAFPAWTGRDGFPLSWLHYLIGMRRLTVAAARDSLRIGTAFAMSQAKREEWRRWLRETRAAAGL
jgi:hypothetical protein